MRWAFVVLLGAGSYGILSTFAKLAYGEGFSPAEVIGSEMMIGAVMAWSVVLLTRGRPRLFAEPGTGNADGNRPVPWPGLLAVGSLIGLTTSLYFSSVRHVPASIAIVLLFQFTWIGVLFDSVRRRRWPSRRHLVALLLLFGGTLLSGGILEGDWSELPVPGIVFGLLAAVSFATYINLSGVVGTDVPPLRRSAIMLTGALLLVLIVFPPTFLWQGTSAPGLWRWGLLLGFFGCIVPTVCFAAGIPRVGGGLATILSSAELPTAVIMSALVLREPVSLTKWVGVLVILAGIVWAETGGRE